MKLQGFRKDLPHVSDKTEPAEKERLASAAGIGGREQIPSDFLHFNVGLLNIGQPQSLPLMNDKSAMPWPCLPVGQDVSPFMISPATPEAPSRR